jgi:hypothetical protein
MLSEALQGRCRHVDWSPLLQYGGSRASPEAVVFPWHRSGGCGKERKRLMSRISYLRRGARRAGWYANFPEKPANILSPKGPLIQPQRPVDLAPKGRAGNVAATLRRHMVRRSTDPMVGKLAATRFVWHGRPGHVRAWAGCPCHVAAPQRGEITKPRATPWV